MLVLNVLGGVCVGARRSTSSCNSLTCHGRSDHPLLRRPSHPLLLHTSSHLLLTTSNLHPTTTSHKLTSTSHHLWLLLPSSHHTTTSHRAATNLSSLLVHHGLTSASSHPTWCSHPHLAPTTSASHHYLAAPVVYHLHPRPTSHSTTASSRTRLAHHLRASWHHLFLWGAKLPTHHAGIESRRAASLNGLWGAHHWPGWRAWRLPHWCRGRCWGGSRFWFWRLNWHCGRLDIGHYHL